MQESLQYGRLGRRPVGIFKRRAVVFYGVGVFEALDLVVGFVVGQDVEEGVSLLGGEAVGRHDLLLLCIRIVRINMNLGQAEPDNAR